MKEAEFVTPIECEHSNLQLSVCDLSKFPEAKPGLLMCCIKCGKQVREATRQEWFESYSKQALAEAYPYGVIYKPGTKEVLRGATAEEHKSWLKGGDLESQKKRP